MGNLFNGMWNWLFGARTIQGGPKGYTRKTGEPSLARGFIERGAEAYVALTAQEKDTSVEDALALRDLPKASTYMGRDTVSSPISGNIGSYVGATNPRISGAMSALAQRDLITDRHAERLFAQAQTPQATVRQGRRTQGLGSSQIKGSLSA